MIPDIDHLFGDQLCYCHDIQAGGDELSLPVSTVPTYGLLLSIECPLPSYLFHELAADALGLDADINQLVDTAPCWQTTADRLGSKRFGR